MTVFVVFAQRLTLIQALLASLLQNMFMDAVIYGTAQREDGSQ
jgi:hypothetical protein